VISEVSIIEALMIKSILTAVMPQATDSVSSKLRYLVTCGINYILFKAI